jgi:hypothetical protein
MSENLIQLTNRAALFSSIAGVLCIVWIICIALFFITIYFTEDKIDEAEALKYEADTPEEKKKYKGKAYLWAKRQDRFLTIIFLSGVLAFIAMIVFIVITPRNLSGRVSQMNQMQTEVVRGDVSINGYYVIEYDRVDKFVSISLYVRNNGQRNVAWAHIKEAGSENFTVVQDLKPGEEVLVTIQTKKSDNYKFEIEDVNYR